MQAITTRYIGPSRTKPSRIKAKCDAGSLTVSYHSVDDCRDHAEKYEKVARMLAEKLGWIGEGYGDLITASIGDSHYVHVLSMAPVRLRNLCATITAGNLQGNPYCNSAMRDALRFLSNFDGRDYLGADSLNH
jgi:hypothetical protein